MKKKILTEAPKYIRDLALAGKKLSIPRQWIGKNGKPASTYAQKASRIENINKAIDQFNFGRQAARLKSTPEKVKEVAREEVVDPGIKILGFSAKKPKIRTVIDKIEGTENRDAAKELIEKGRNANVISIKNAGYNGQATTTGRPLSTIRKTNYTHSSDYRPESGLEFFDYGDGVQRPVRTIADKVAMIKKRMSNSKGKGPLSWLVKQEEKIGERLAAEEELKKVAAKKARRIALANDRATKKLTDMFEPYGDAFEV